MSGTPAVMPAPAAVPPHTPTPTPAPASAPAHQACMPAWMPEWLAQHRMAEGTKPHSMWQLLGEPETQAAADMKLAQLHDQMRSFTFRGSRLVGSASTPAGDVGPPPANVGAAAGRNSGRGGHLTAFQLFQKTYAAAHKDEVQAVVVSEHGDSRAVNKLIASVWRALPEDDKNHYTRMASEHNQRIAEVEQAEQDTLWRRVAEDVLAGMKRRRSNSVPCAPRDRGGLGAAADGTGNIDGFDGEDGVDLDDLPGTGGVVDPQRSGVFQQLPEQAQLVFGDKQVWQPWGFGRAVIARPPRDPKRTSVPPMLVATTQLLAPSVQQRLPKGRTEAAAKFGDMCLEVPTDVCALPGTGGPNSVTAAAPPPAQPLAATPRVARRVDGNDGAPTSSSSSAAARTPRRRSNGGSSGSGGTTTSGAVAATVSTPVVGTPIVARIADDTAAAAAAAAATPRTTRRTAVHSDE